MPTEGGDALCALGISDLARRFRAGTLSPVDVLGAALERIDRLNPRLGAYITVTRDAALASARQAELELEAGADRGALHGIPVSLKDLIRMRGARTTGASRVLADAPDDEADAVVVSRLRRAGAVVVGKTNLDPFGVALADPDDPFGWVDHPRRPGYQTGGSSSGSAAAVGAGLCAVSFGTDAGGSVRHPASVCGVVGFKPSHDLVPLEGVISSSPARDHVGILARSVLDVGLALEGAADPGGRAGRGGPYLAEPDRGVRGLRLGVPTDAWARAGGPNAERLLDEARAALTDLGMVRVDVELPESAHANEAGRVLLGADHYAYHRRALADGAPYSSDMHARARQWQAITPAEVAWATAACGSILEEWSEVFRRADVVMLPANLAAPPQHREDAVEIDGAMLPVQQVNSRFNRVSNLTGNPALVLPAGESSDGFPIAAQLVGPRGEDAVVLRAGLALEQALGSLAVAWGINPAQP